MQEALTYLKDAIIEEPQNAEVWVWIAAMIDDLDKQEIFLEKALAIDPRSIPAQRGLAYLQKRKRDQTANTNDHLSDHTSPISPFPAAVQEKPEKPRSQWAKLEQSEVDSLADLELDVDKPEKTAPRTSGIFKNLPHLRPVEIILLGVVVIVFCFIGILAASALFDFDLPLGFLDAKQFQPSSDPPYPGVFLFEDGVYFDIQRHIGLPSQELGMPVSNQVNPTVILWQSQADPEVLSLIYQSGEYQSFQLTSEKKQLYQIQPDHPLAPGLYCLQQAADNPAVEAAYYWCFRIDLQNPE